MLSEAEASGKAQIITETHDRKFQLVMLLLLSAYKPGKRYRPAKWLVPSVTTNKEDGGKHSICLLTHKMLSQPARLGCHHTCALRSACTQVNFAVFGYTQDGCEGSIAVLAIQEGHALPLSQVYAAFTQLYLCFCTYTP